MRFDEVLFQSGWLSVCVFDFLLIIVVLIVGRQTSGPLPVCFARTCPLNSKIRMRLAGIQRHSVCCSSIFNESYLCMCRHVS